MKHRFLLEDTDRGAGLGLGYGAFLLWDSTCVGGLCRSGCESVVLGEIQLWQSKTGKHWDIQVLMVVDDAALGCVGKHWFVGEC